MLVLTSALWLVLMNSVSSCMCVKNSWLVRLCVLGESGVSRMMVLVCGSRLGSVLML